MKNLIVKKARGLFRLAEFRKNMILDPKFRDIYTQFARKLLYNMYGSDDIQYADVKAFIFDCRSLPKLKAYLDVFDRAVAEMGLSYSLDSSLLKKTKRLFFRG